MQVDSTTYENTYTSAIEVFLFRTQPPERVFCYPGMHSEGQIACNFMGARLGGLIYYKGCPFQDNYGGKRQALSFVGLSGHWYHGYRYTHNGDYIRAKRGKPSGRKVY